MKKHLFFAIMAMAVSSGYAQMAEDGSVEDRISDVESRFNTVEGRVSKLSKMKVSGYIQAQYQHGDENASLKVGEANETLKTDSPEGFDRFGVRRGRAKLTYTEGIVSGVFQIDLTEKGVSFKDVYIDIKDPWMKRCGLKLGLFDRPFGYEITYSSSRRESPERSTVFQTLFPDERDLGAQLILTPAKTSPFSFLKLTAGVFAGNGIKKDVKSRRDFIGHIDASKNISNVGKWGVGASVYLGSVFQNDSTVYEMKDGAFIASKSGGNIGKYAKRQYFGFDARFEIETPIGFSKLTAEYLFGTQPGLAGSSKSPNGGLFSGPVFIRDFSGYYVQFVQSLGHSPVSVVVKYDAYDANCDVEGNEVGVSGTNTSKTDLEKSTLGFGAIWRINNALKMTAYYEVNKNEESVNVKGYDEDRKDNVLTLRMQYKF